LFRRPLGEELARARRLTRLRWRGAPGLIVEGGVRERGIAGAGSNAALSMPLLRQGRPTKTPPATKAGGSARSTSKGRERGRGEHNNAPLGVIDFQKSADEYPRVPRQEHFSPLLDRVESWECSLLDSGDPRLSSNSSLDLEDQPATGLVAAVHDAVVVSYGVVHSGENIAIAGRKLGDEGEALLHPTLAGAKRWFAYYVRQRQITARTRRATGYSAPEGKFSLYIRAYWPNQRSSAGSPALDTGSPANFSL